MRIVFLDADTVGRDVSLDPIEKAGDLVVYGATMPGEVMERIADADVVITNKVVIKREHIDVAPKLKLICVAATGTNNVDSEYAASKGIPVRNVAGYSTESVAQVTIMHILNLVGHSIYFDNVVKSGDYSRSGMFTDISRPFFELKGKRLGVIGMGNIGQRVSEIATAFGMEVSYFSTSGTSHCSKYPSIPIEQLLSESDVVSINAPLNAVTKNLITYQKLSLMKPTGYIVNVGRGGIINEGDLVRALNDGLIAAAAIDVFEVEPLPENHPYITLLNNPEKLILSPHIAWTSREARLELIRKVAENIKKK